jgi:hypothetical protein
MIGDYRVASLVDTNVMVYCYDPSDPRKRAMARDLLRRGAATSLLRIPHQAMVEFVNAVTRQRPAGLFSAGKRRGVRLKTSSTSFRFFIRMKKCFAPRCSEWRRTGSHGMTRTFGPMPSIMA